MTHLKAGSPLQELARHGQSVWLDDLSRSLLRSGELARLVREEAVVGVTSNPTIFDKALGAGDAYDAQLSTLFSSGVDDEKELYLALSGDDVRIACALLRPVWEETAGVDGYVSWEVDPELADDRAATTGEAVRLHGRIHLPNLYVKIPATDAGVLAIEDAIAAGLNINVTLIFSRARHEAVMEAYLRGLERLVAAGGDPSPVHSVASFFVSRVDGEADRRLAAVGRSDLAGKLAVANAKLAYQAFLRVFSSDRFLALAERGARVQRCLWASTSTKNPAYRDVMYVEQLIGADTVNTMPRPTMVAFQDHGVVADTLARGIDEAKRVFDDVRAAGVDYDDVCRFLERDGVKKFAESFTALKRTLAQKTAALAAVTARSW